MVKLVLWGAFSGLDSDWIPENERDCDSSGSWKNHKKSTQTTLINHQLMTNPPQKKWGHTIYESASHKVGPPTSYKYGYNSTYRGYNPSYPIIRPFIGFITPFITSRGPPPRMLDRGQIGRFSYRDSRT